MRKARTLADCLSAEANSFNLVRLTAALCVLVSHSFVVVFGKGAAEPLMASTPYTLGQHAVNAFFIISGLLLAQSLDRDGDLLRFCWARLLRIFPGLLAYGLVFALVMGPLLTTLTPEVYFTDAHTFAYPLEVVHHFQNAPAPHGIFAETPFGAVVNDPLWTIRYELAAYIGLAAIFALGLLRGIFRVTLVLAAVLALFLLAEVFISRSASGDTFIHHLVRYGLCFMIGVTAFHQSPSIPVSPWLLAITALATLLARDTIFEAPAFFLFVAHLVFVLASRRWGKLTSWTQRADGSYGTYIYGWPIQQSLIVLFPGIGVAALAVAAVAIAPIFGFASWRLVEAPALRLNASALPTSSRGTPGDHRRRGIQCDQPDGQESSPLGSNRHQAAMPRVPSLRSSEARRQ